MSKLRIGLIGFGAWARSAYLPALKYDGRVEVAAVTASSEKTRLLAREILGDKVEVFPNYQELLSSDKIDAVMVAVPDQIHSQALAAALKSGLPTFYEPPIAHTRQELMPMLELLLAAPQVSFAHLELCAHPGIKRATELCGSIGTLQNVTVNLYANWGCTKDSDVCLLNRMSCWYVDVLNHIVSSLPKRVLILDGKGGLGGRMQSVSTGVYDYDGTWGFIRANVKSAEGVSIIVELSGDEGDVVLDYFTGELKYRTLSQPQWTVEVCSPAKPFADWPGVRETISGFITAAISGDREQGNAKAVAKLNRIGLAAEESKDSGDWAVIKYE